MYQHTHNGSSRRKGDRERILENVMAENSPNLMKIINLHVQEAPWNPSRTKSNKYIYPGYEILGQYLKINFISENKQKHLENKILK